MEEDQECLACMDIIDGHSLDMLILVRLAATLLVRDTVPSLDRFIQSNG